MDSAIQNCPIDVRRGLYKVISNDFFIYSRLSAVALLALNLVRYRRLNLLNWMSEKICTKFVALFGTIEHRLCDISMKKISKAMRNAAI